LTGASSLRLASTAIFIFTPEIFLQNDGDYKTIQQEYKRAIMHYFH